MQDREDDIIRYLRGEMSASENTTFEQRIQQDDALKEEVAFQRGLLDFILHDEPALESKLNALGEAFFIKRQQQKRRLIIGAIAVVAITVLIYLFFFRKTTPQQFNAPEQPVPQDTIVPKEIINIKDTIAPYIPPKKENKTIDTTPIAEANPSLYVPNQNMERLINEQYRNDKTATSTTVTNPQPDAIFSSSQLVKLRVDGFSTVEPPYQLYIYSNRDFEIENDYYNLSTSLNTQKEGEQFNFFYNANIPLDKGLYYLIIKELDTRKLIYIARFSVE